MKACPIVGCRARIGDRFLMCTPHWRLLPNDVRALWRDIVRDLDQALATRSHEGIAAWHENKAEVVRIAEAASAGVLA